MLRDEVIYLNDEDRDLIRAALRRYGAELAHQWRGATNPAPELGEEMDRIEAMLDRIREV